MKSPGSTSTPRKPAWAKCEICRDVPSYDVIEYFVNESFPAAVYRLEELGNLRRCPLCSTFYLMKHGSDTHHFMSAETTITRISKKKAFDMLAPMLAQSNRRNFDADKAKLWMGDHDVDSHVSELVSKLKTADAAENAATLAKVYFQGKDWGKLEALLRHKKSSVRGGALGAAESWLGDTPAKIIDAAVALLEDKTHARSAHEAFNRPGYNSVSPSFMALVDCLEHNKVKVRALAVDSIIHLLEPDSGYYIGKDGVGTYGPRKHPKLGKKITKALFSRLPLLVAHIVKPRPAPWVDIDAYPRSYNARELPKKLTTGIGASKILNAMIISGKANKARVGQAFETARPQLQKMLSGHKAGDLDADVYLFLYEVMREGEQ